MEKSAELLKKSQGNFFLHKKVDYLSNIPVGKIVRLSDNELLAAGMPGPNEYCDNKADVFSLYRSSDEGLSWEKLPWNTPGFDVEPTPTGALICTSAGNVVAAFPSLREKYWTWDDERKDAPGAILPTYAMRSTDWGRTWTDIQRLHTEWTGATRDILETRDGCIVFAAMKMLHHPGRHTVLTYSSPDDGISWQPSNIIDLGGNGHHDGAIEATLVELSDGRLLEYIRTMWGSFWRAESTDGGRYWHPYGPTEVRASSAPGMLFRLASGRIGLLWNRPHPQGDPSYDKLRGGDGVWSAVPASNYREELSISFSEDECLTWSNPVAIARGEKEISYPFAFEVKPGVLWITAHRWNFRVALREKDFAPG